VTLDGSVQKTLKKDDLLSPSKALADAIASEWDQQSDTLVVKNLLLNKLMTSNMQLLSDPKEITLMRAAVYTHLENDQIC
jgi:chaperone required for assembly of F1-ATPase